VTTVAFLLSTVIGLLLAETRVSREHERRLRARGALLPDGDVYRALALLYPAAFLAMGAEGIWRAAHGLTLPFAESGPSWTASGVVLFVASKALKYWAIGALGERWTFRVYVEPQLPLVTSGPYRYIAHPNYVAVVGELVGAAMMFGALITGPIMFVLFGAALRARVRFETRVLREATGGRGTSE
jgi:methyltransferase